MANQWTTPPTDRQGRQVIPPTPEHPGPAFQQNMPMHQRDEYPTFQNCHCTQCSAMRHAEAEPPNWYPVEQQDPSYSGSGNIPLLSGDRAVGNRAETAMIVPSHAQAQLTPPQTARILENFDYDLAHERLGPYNIDLIRVPMLDASIREGRRRLAGRYLNNPNASVSTIRLEPGASGRLQVVITVEMITLF